MSESPTSAGGDTTNQPKASKVPAAMCSGSRGGESLEDLLCTLQSQIKSSDWLKQNTAEKWEAENPSLAKEYKEAMKARSEDTENPT